MILRKTARSLLSDGGFLFIMGAMLNDCIVNTLENLYLPIFIRRLRLWRTRLCADDEV